MQILMQQNGWYDCVAYTLRVLAETAHSKNCCLHFNHVVRLQPPPNTVQHSSEVDTYWQAEFYKPVMDILSLRYNGRNTAKNPKIKTNVSIKLKLFLLP